MIGRLLLILGLIFVFQKVAVATDITQIGFKGNQSPNLLEIQANGPVQIEKQENLQDKQIVLEIKGAKLPKHLSRKIDTSSFDSNVSLISPYQVQGQEDTVRVVLQLRSEGGADLTQEGNLIKISIPNSSSNPTQNNSAASGGVASDAPPMPVSEQDVTDVVLDKISKKQEAAPVANSKGSPSTKGDRLDEFMTSLQTKRFTGRPITLNLRDVEITDAFRLIADASGFNIVIGEGVTGKISLSLSDVPWDQALDVILHTMRLGAERNHNILRIVTLRDLTNEKREELNAKSAVEASAPRITRIFPISYANLDQIQNTLTRFIGATAAAAGVSAASGAVLSDNRTNSIIVLDTPANVERMKKLIELLDTQTPQVMIEAKVIEATESFGRTIRGNLGVAAIDTPGAQFLGSLNGGTYGQLTPSVTTTGTTTTVSGPTATAPDSLFNAAIVASPLRINAVLNMQESEGKLKVISSPKTVVLNRERATILQSFPTLGAPTVTVANGVTTTTPNVVSANLSLEVRPAVTNEGSVVMELNLTRDTIVSLGPTVGDVGRRNIRTNVLVESGNTLIIGGVYTSSQSSSEDGFPLLRKLPIVGPLFGGNVESTARSELFFFITPRILNAKEAGIAS